MGAILGIGMSHYPGFLYPDREMAMRVKQVITSPKVPERLKDPDNWPAPMRAEWSDDEGAAFAARHRAAFLAGVRKARAAIDAFGPDYVVIFGDDQYENFREDIIPPFCIFLQDEFRTQPFMRGRAGKPQPNVWGEPTDRVVVTRGEPMAAKALATALLDAGFDMAYAYRMLHHEGLGHAFVNTLLAPAATLVVWMAFDQARTGKITAVGAATAIVVGLVAVTPAAGFIGPISAIALGAVAALPSYFGILRRSRTRLDDSLDVFAAHGLGGMTGALLTGVLAAAAWGGASGLVEGNAKQVGVQAIAVLATLVYSAGASYALMRLVGWAAALGAEPKLQSRGLDIELHGEEAYSNGEGAILVLPETRPEAEQPAPLPAPVPSPAGG